MSSIIDNKIFYSNPVFVMFSYWCFFTLSSYLAIRNIYSWTYSGIIWILCACIFFLFGNLIGKISISLVKNHLFFSFQKYDTNTISRISWIFILVCILIGLSHTVIQVIRNGFSFIMFLDLDSLLLMNNTMAFRRYSYGALPPSILTQITLVFVYTSTLCGGYAVVYSNTKIQRIICYFTFLPVTIRLLFANEKVGLISCVLFWFSGYIVSHLNRYKEPPKLKLKILLKIIFYIAIVFLTLYLTMILRIGKYDPNVVKIVNNKFIKYAFSSVPNFDYWFDNYNYRSNLSYGQFTFYGIFRTFKISAREQGVYSESGPIGTNVYTALRGIIQDFGVAGGLVYILIFGISSGLSYYHIIKIKRSSIFSITMLVIVYHFTYYSFIVSSFTYFSYIMSFFVFMIFLRLSFNKINPKKKTSIKI